MSTTSIDFFNNFSSQASELGQPLPNQDHACSVSMPKWNHVIKYEEGCDSIVSTLKCGYPRFFIHPFVDQVNKLYSKKLTSEDKSCFVFPTEASAWRCRDFVQATIKRLHGTEVDIEVESISVLEAAAIIYSKQYEEHVKEFWQHSGEILSSRYAEYILNAQSSCSEKCEVSLRDSESHFLLAKRLANLFYERDENVICYPSGMAALFSAHRLVSSIRKHKKSVLFGFPYLDTLKILRRPEWSSGVHFFPNADESDYESLHELLKCEEVVGIFTEFPSNPLLHSPDLERLSGIAHENGSVLVVDDTIGSFNVDAKKHGCADIVVSSLTKIFSGSGNVMGGSLVLNSKGPKYRELKSKIEKFDGFIFGKDVEVLLSSSDDLIPRRNRINDTARIIAKRLSDHELVERVYYPELVNSNIYRRFLRDEDSEKLGYGPLISFLIKGGENSASVFYDFLDLSKGPSLGTNFTLCCPYTLLAHYNELDFVASCGVQRHLIRISIGLEPVEHIWDKILIALENVAHIQ